METTNKKQPKKAKPTLKVSKSKFLDFMLDEENGISYNAIKKAIKKKGSFTIEDIIKDCGYIESAIILNPKVVTKELKMEDYGDDFEVDPKDFTIVFVK